MFRLALKEAALVAGGISVVGTVAGVTAHASDDVVHPTEMPWSHGGMLSSYDHASLRRGHMVYTQVCASCHSLDLIAYRNLIGVMYTEDEIKAISEEIEVEDGPNDEGEMFMRPGKPSDRLPAPYANEQAGRSANGGAYPPDLSLITKARHGGADYVFALITGYAERPAGVPEPRQGLYYNPYFAGGLIGMPPPLMADAVEFPDGTEASVSQMAKDVCTFLTWAAEPEMEDRKLLGMRTMVAMVAMAAIAGYYKRFKWSIFKTRRHYYRPDAPGMKKM